MASTRIYVDTAYSDLVASDSFARTANRFREKASAVYSGSAASGRTGGGTIIVGGGSPPPIGPRAPRKTQAEKNIGRNSDEGGGKGSRVDGKEDEPGAKRKAQRVDLGGVWFEENGRGQFKDVKRKFYSLDGSLSIDLEDMPDFDLPELNPPQRQGNQYEGVESGQRIVVVQSELHRNRRKSRYPVGPGTIIAGYQLETKVHRAYFIQQYELSWKPRITPGEGLEAPKKILITGEYSQASLIQSIDGYASTETFVLAKGASLLKRINIPAALQLPESLRNFQWETGSYDPPFEDKLFLGSFLVTLVGDPPFETYKYLDKLSIDDDVTKYAFNIMSRGGGAVSGKETILISRDGYVEVDRDLMVASGAFSWEQPPDLDYSGQKDARLELACKGLCNRFNIVGAGVFHFPRVKGTDISVEGMKNEQIAQIFFPPTPQNPARRTENSWAPNYNVFINLGLPITDGEQGREAFVDYPPFNYRPRVFPGRDLVFDPSFPYDAKPLLDSTPGKSILMPISVPPIPQNAVMNVYDRELLCSWDWNDPDYCKAQLLALGFRPEDISFRPIATG